MEKCWDKTRIKVCCSADNPIEQGAEGHLANLEMERMNLGFLGWRPREIDTLSFVDVGKIDARLARSTNNHEDMEYLAEHFTK